MSGFTDNASFFANQFRLFQMIDVMSKRYEIPVVRNFGHKKLLDQNGYHGQALRCRQEAEGRKDDPPAKTKQKREKL